MFNRLFRKPTSNSLPSSIPPLPSEQTNKENAASLNLPTPCGDPNPENKAMTTRGSRQAQKPARQHDQVQQQVQQQPLQPHGGNGGEQTGGGAPGGDAPKRQREYIRMLEERNR